MNYTDDLNFNIYPELTIDYILQYVSEEDIFAKYLGIPSSMVSDGAPICNPLRDDNKPDCSFYYADDGRLRFTDFAGYTANGRFKSWDCFDCVVNVINMTERTKIPFTDKNGVKKLASVYLDISPTSGYITLEEGGKQYKRSKISFAVMLRHIAKQFKIHKYSGAQSTEQLNFIKADKTYRSKKDTFTKITATLRDWNKYDSNYWMKYKLDPRSKPHKPYFKAFGMNPVYQAYINDKLVYTYSKNDPCYAYYCGKDELGRIHVKLYFPKRDGTEKYKPKFYCNTKRLQGLSMLTPSKFGILQKAMKDVAAQRIHYGITGVAPQAESNLITKDQWDDIRFDCDYWFSLGDFDYAGIRFGILHFVEYGIIPIFFPRKDTPIKKRVSISSLRKLYVEFGRATVRKILDRPNMRYFDEKDFSDNLEALKVDGMLSVIQEAIQYFELDKCKLYEYYKDLLDWT